MIKKQLFLIAANTFHTDLFVQVDGRYAVFCPDKAQIDVRASAVLVNARKNP
jgi:hypothetical protein